MFNTWGIALAFGTFQTYYESPQSPITANPSQIAWIGSLQTFLLLFIGALTGRLYDAGYLRLLLFTGTFLVVFGTMMTSLVNKYYQAILAQGLCIGLGAGCLLIPSVGAPSTWFAKRRGLAIGCVTCGSAVGGVVMPIMLHRLIGEVGFAWAVRIQGFLTLATLLVAIAIMRPRLPPRRGGRAIFEFSALREPEFALYCVGMLVAMMGFYVFYSFVGPWVVDTGLDAHGVAPVYFLAVINAASSFGRLLPNFLSDVVGPLNVQGPAMLVAGVLTLCWIAVHSLAPLLVLCVLYGFFSGALIGLPPAAVASLTQDMNRFGARMGLAFGFLAIGSLVGTPITGAIIGNGRGGGNDYDGARIWSGVTIVAGSFLVGGARMVISRRAGKLLIKV